MRANARLFLYLQWSSGCRIYINPRKSAIHLKNTSINIEHRSFLYYVTFGSIRKVCCDVYICMSFYYLMFFFFFLLFHFSFVYLSTWLWHHSHILPFAWLHATLSLTRVNVLHRLYRFCMFHVHICASWRIGLGFFFLLCSPSAHRSSTMLHLFKHYECGKRALRIWIMAKTEN